MQIAFPIILTSLIWSITLIHFFIGKIERIENELRGKMKRSLASGHEQIPRKAGSLSDILAHKCNRETSENKVSLINAQNTLPSSSGIEGQRK